MRPIYNFAKIFSHEATKMRFTRWRVRDFANVRHHAIHSSSAVAQHQVADQVQRHGLHRGEGHERRGGHPGVGGMQLVAEHAVALRRDAGGRRLRHIPGPKAESDPNLTLAISLTFQVLMAKP